MVFNDDGNTTLSIFELQNASFKILVTPSGIITLPVLEVSHFTTIASLPSSSHSYVIPSIVLYFFSLSFSYEQSRYSKCLWPGLTIFLFASFLIH